MKEAIFLIVDTGEDGKGPEEIIFATRSETERDNKIPPINPGPLRPVDRVYDMEVVKKNLMDKLSGLDKLALGLQKPHPVTRGGTDGS